MIPLLTAAATLAAVLVGYVLGRLRPWRMLGDWAVDELRHGGRWAHGSKLRQWMFLMVWAVTSPGAVLRVWRFREELSKPMPFGGAMKPKIQYDPEWATREPEGPS